MCESLNASIVVFFVYFGADEVVTEFIGGNPAVTGAEVCVENPVAGFGKVVEKEGIQFDRLLRWVYLPALVGHTEQFCRPVKRRPRIFGL